MPETVVKCVPSGQLGEWSVWWGGESALKYCQSDGPSISMGTCIDDPALISGQSVRDKHIHVGLRHFSMKSHVIRCRSLTRDAQQVGRNVFSGRVYAICHLPTLNPDISLLEILTDYVDNPVQAFSSA